MGFIWPQGEAYITLLYSRFFNSLDSLCAVCMSRIKYFYVILQQAVM